MSQDVLDLEEFKERVQDDKELMLELFDIFIEDYKEKRQTLSVAVEKQDYEQIKSVAHSIKGASGNISAKALRESYLTLEEMGKNANLAGIDGLLTTIDQQFEALQARIEEIKKESAG